jgi:2-polyprenyl-3-methyl-5-hydroxy-6-metoxy-1,4-benzoquinol methylase
MIRLLAALDGPGFHGRLPCVFCRYSRSRKSRVELQNTCGACRNLSESEVRELLHAQEKDPDRVVIPPNMLRLSRLHSDWRYQAATAVLREHGIAPGARVLDVGCGVSAQTALLRAYRSVGVDVNLARLRFAAAEQSGCGYAAQSASLLGFREGSFDAVLCLEVIEHFPAEERVKVIRELFRVLSGRGILLLSTPDGRSTPWKTVLGAKCEKSHFHELPQAEVEKLVSDGGGSVIAYQPVQGLIQPAGKVTAMIAHCVAEKPGLRRQLGNMWASLGYRTLLYAAVRARRVSSGETGE